MCFRKTGIDGGMSSGIPGSYVSMMFGQKNLASKVNYMSPTDSTQKATNLVLQNVINGELNSSPMFKDIYAQERKINANVDPSPSPSHNANEELCPDVPPTEMSGSSKKDVEKKKKKKKDRKKVESSSSSSSESSSSESENERSRRKIKKLKAKIKKLEPSQHVALPSTAFQVPVQIVPQQFLQCQAFPQQLPQYQILPQLLPNYQMVPQQFPPYQLFPGNPMQADARTFQTVKPQQQQVLTRTITQTQTLAKGNNNFIVDEIDN